MKRFKGHFFYIMIILLLLVGMYLLVSNKFRFLQPRTVEESSTVVLEKINKVVKLVAVEAQLSEVLNKNEYIYANYWPFQKKVLVIIKGKVSAGYDFEKFHFVVDEKTKTISIDKWPEPEILSIDHDLEYYDISSGLMNEFTMENHNEIQREAKVKIENAALQSGILLKAEEQLNDFKSMMKEILEVSGWTIIYPENPINTEALQLQTTN